jgi:hypothetical protein
MKPVGQGRLGSICGQARIHGYSCPFVAKIPFPRFARLRRGGGLNTHTEKATLPEFNRAAHRLSNQLYDFEPAAPMQCVPGAALPMWVYRLYAVSWQSENCLRP